jgi:hypothetical protein
MPPLLRVLDQLGGLLALRSRLVYLLLQFYLPQVWDETYEKRSDIMKTISMNALQNVLDVLLK